jgi:hypothetical protein
MVGGTILPWFWWNDHIISCSGPGSPLEVAFLLMDCLMGSESTQEIRKYLIYKKILFGLFIISQHAVCPTHKLQNPAQGLKGFCECH